MKAPDTRHDSTRRTNFETSSLDEASFDSTRPQGHATIGHWIRMFKALWDHPKVASMCELLNCVEALVIGALFRLWSLADTHSTDGRLELSAGSLNRKIGVDGFAEADATVGWLEIGDGFIAVVRSRSVGPKVGSLPVAR